MVNNATLQFESTSQSGIFSGPEPTAFDLDQIKACPPAREYAEHHGVTAVHDAFTVANILHTHKHYIGAAAIYGLAFRLHSQDPGHYPLAQSLLQARLLCLLKAGVSVPKDELDTLRSIIIPFANYIAGIESAWQRGDGATALAEIGNAFEEFHTGEEIDSLYLSIVRSYMPELLQGEASGPARIPFRVFMYWDQNPPPEIRENFEYHRQIPGLDFQVYDKECAQEWLYQNYGVEARSLFLGARHPAEAADFLRVHVIQSYGGWWLDADISLREGQGPRFLQEQTAQNVLLLTDNGVVHNDFYGGVQNSVIGQECLLSLYRNCYLHRNLFIAYKTGPGIFNRTLCRLAHRALMGSPPKQSIAIYDYTMFDHAIHQFPTPYKHQLPSWHTA